MNLSKCVPFLAMMTLSNGMLRNKLNGNPPNNYNNNLNYTNAGGNDTIDFLVGAMDANDVIKQPNPDKPKPKSSTGESGYVV